MEASIKFFHFRTSADDIVELVCMAGCFIAFPKEADVFHGFQKFDHFAVEVF